MWANFLRLLRRAVHKNHPGKLERGKDNQCARHIIMLLNDTKDLNLAIDNLSKRFQITQGHLFSFSIYSSFHHVVFRASAD